jgi:hypothetical protein
VDAVGNGCTVDIDMEGRTKRHATFLTGAFVALVIGVQVSTLAIFVSSTWFKHDDFVILFRTTTDGGFPGTLLTANGGHLLPGLVGLYWVFRAIFGMQWWPFVAFIVGSQAFASYLTWRVIKSFFGLRPISVLLLLVYCSSVLTLSANMWAIAAIQYLPLQIAFPATVLLLQRYTKHRNICMALLVTGPVLIASLFFEKAFMIVPFVIALCAMTPLTKNCSTSWKGRSGELRTPLCLMSAVTVAYACFYQIATSGSPGKASLSMQALSNFDLAPLNVNLWASLFGGPGKFSRDGWQSLPVAFEIKYSLAIVSILFVWSIARNWAASKYWILLLAMACTNLVLIALAGRSYAELSPRYMSDLVFPMVLLIGLAVLGNSNDARDGFSSALRVELRLPSGARSFIIFLGGVILFAHSGQSQLVMFAAMKNAPGENYVSAALRSANAAAGTPTLIPHPVPADLIGPIWGLSGENSTKTVLVPAEMNIRFGTVVEDPFMVLADGSIVPARFDSISKPIQSGSQCLNAAPVGSATLEMNNAPIIWSWYVRLSYTSAATTNAVFVWSGPSFTVELNPGLHTVFFPIVGGGNAMTVATSVEGACIKEIEVVQLKLDD